MKKFITYTGFICCCWLFLQACQQEDLEITDSSLSRPLPEQATIEIIPTFGKDILQETEIVPMSRAENLIRTRILNRYKTVIVKKTANKWIVDTLIVGKIDPTLEKNEWSTATIDVHDAVSLPPIRLALRPGIYKAGFFLNDNNQKWNPDIKPGYVVSEKEDITPYDSLPVAYTYAIQKDPEYHDYNRIQLTYEPFAGWTSFTIQKNDTLGPTGPLPQQILTLERRATRFRFLLKDTTVIATVKGQAYDLAFRESAYTLRANFNVSKTTPFCQGLNILGGGYYPKDTLCTSLQLVTSTLSTWYTSPINHRKYHACIPASSTYPTYLILMDEYYDKEGIECELEVVILTGPSSYETFLYDKKIKLRLWRNRISGVIFEPSPREAAVVPDEYNPAISTFYMEENTEANPVDLFDAFFELNPTKLSE